jgi:hypothetical protein
MLVTTTNTKQMESKAKTSLKKRKNDINNTDAEVDEAKASTVWNVKKWASVIRRMNAPEM